MPSDIVGLQASLLAAAEHTLKALSDIEVCVFSRHKT
jgi:CRP-like cAMP-binding protein